MTFWTHMYFNNIRNNTRILYILTTIFHILFTKVLYKHYNRKAQIKSTYACPQNWYKFPRLKHVQFSTAKTNFTKTSISRSITTDLNNNRPNWTSLHRKMIMRKHSLIWKTLIKQFHALWLYNLKFNNQYGGINNQHKHNVSVL